MQADKKSFALIPLLYRLFDKSIRTLKNPAAGANINAPGLIFLLVFSYSITINTFMEKNMSVLSRLGIEIASVPCVYKVSCDSSVI